MRILQKFYKYICFSGPDQYLSKKYDLSNQKKILNKLLSKYNADSLGDTQRSYLQYRATVSLYRKLTILLLNIISVFFLIYYIISCACKGLVVKNDNNCAEGGSVLIPKYWPYLESMLPQAEIAHGSTVYFSEKGVLNFSVLKFYWHIFKRYPFSVYFHIKNIRHLAKYNYNILMYKPSAIIVCREYSCSSSVLTQYCEGLGIDHINVMHGHKLFVIQDSFFRFTRCYVWDELYKKLFISMYAEQAQFVVWDMLENVAIKSAIQKRVKIYLGGLENEERAIKAIRQLKRSGYKNIVVRTHPAYPLNMNVILNEGDVFFEEPRSVAILDSLAEASLAVGEVTTCLVIAKLFGVDVVVNDLDHALCDRYAMLKALDILQPCRMLSNLCENRIY